MKQQQERIGRADRFYVQKDKHADFQRLSQGENAAFENMFALWTVAAALGYRVGRRQPLQGGRQHVGFWHYLSQQEDIPLLQAIAVAETGDVAVLADQAQILKIAEEYANGGIDLLVQDERSQGGATIRALAGTVLDTAGSPNDGETVDSSPPPEILSTDALVTLDEGARVEFKESARWNVIANMQDKKMELEVLKTIAGFLNQAGGTLLIGVTDAKEPVGLEADFATFSGKASKKDQFENWFTGVLDTKIGTTETATCVSTRFDEVNGKQVFRVDVAASESPAYVSWENDTHFYVRTSNRTKHLNSRETAKYVAKHWGA